MSGEELKQYIKRSGLTMSDIARELGTTPQNVQARLGRQSMKSDFIQKVKEIAGRCAVPIPEDVGAAVNGSHSPNASQTIGGGDAALAAEVRVLREQNEFLQNQAKTLLAIMGSR